MGKLKGPYLKLVQEEEKEENKKIIFSNCKVKFFGWMTTQNLNDWDSWVRKMCSIHQSTWENSGIYEAIMSSTYIIKRQDNLILELASRWCSQTNTFSFPWGEATITLEDMLVLGGFSASGVSALSSLENDVKSLQIKERLEIARLEIRRTKSKAALQCKWIEMFTDSESDLEHAAFLTLWLSRHVFPVATHARIINKQAISVAARLSRGTKIALGPVVLAMLYRDLGFLAKRIRFTQMVDQSGVDVGQTDLCAPFHLVQIWAWERLPMLKPVPNCMYLFGNFPRLARWSNVRIRSDKDLGSAVDSAEKAFLWCPYGSSFGRCVEAIELIGFDSCIEKYQPERVARQFGLEQEQQRYSTSSQVKVEKAVDGVPPGFTPQIDVIDVPDSDSCSDPDPDHDCSVEITKISKLPRRSFPSSSKSARFQAQGEVVLVDGSHDDDKDNDDQLVQLQPSENESDEANGGVNGSVHETREDEGEVVGTKHDELATSCDAESYTNERSKDSGLDLEARISRLEGIVYARIKALEAAR